MNPDTVQQETGRVITVNGTRAELDVIPGTGCEHCGARNLCNWGGKATRRVVAHNPLGARPGEMVVISRSTRAGAHSALLVFGLPVLLMVAGVVFGSMLGSEIWAGALAGLGLGLAILILRLIDRVRDRKGTNLPIIVHIFTREELKGDENEQRNAGIACPNNSDNSDAKG